jgi:acetyl esterase/lipase
MMIPRLALLIVVSIAPVTLGQPRRPAGPASLPSGTTVKRDIAYVKGGTKAQTLDVFVPANAKEPLPLVIWIHGGGWQAGDKKQCPAIPLLNFGYVVASINYRLTDEGPHPAQINDCKAAVRWLRANAKEYSIDPDRIGVWGGSAGGHLVALLGAAGDAKDLEGDGGNADVSSKVQAVCDFFGPSDLTRVPDPGIANGAVPKLLGGPLKDNLEKAKAASPITYVTADDPPFLIMQGTHDPLVNAEQSRWLYDALKKAGVDAELEMIEGAGHGGPEFAAPQRRKMVLDFFNANLKKPRQEKREQLKTSAQ